MTQDPSQVLKMCHVKHTRKQCIFAKMRHKKTDCSKCGAALEKHRIGVHPYCLKCHAEYSRKRRKPHNKLDPHSKRRAIARAYLNVYVRRGKIQRQSCEICGEKAQAHHDDYSKPLDVRWLCRQHHLMHHKILESIQINP